MRVRTLFSGLAAAVLAAGCGGGGPKTDADAIAQVLENAAKAAADGNGDKACSYLTPDAQRQAVLQIGIGGLGQTDCSQAVGRVQFVLTPLDKKEIKSLQPVNIQINGTAAGATMTTSTGTTPGQPISVQLNLQKVGSNWKISGFVSQQGLPSG